MAGLAVVSAELVVVMVEPTWGSARYPKLKTFYEPIASNKAHNKALVATMGKTLMDKKYKKLIRLSSHPT